jgi:hypothetical protein
MEKENPVYLKLGYYESLGAKRDILSSQASLLNVIKIMRRYNSLREEELRIKANLHKQIKELNSKVKETKSYFPFFEIPEKLKKKISKLKKEESIKEPVKEHVKKIMTKPEIKVPVTRYDHSLESELQNIQDRLRAIERS